MTRHNPLLSALLLAALVAGCNISNEPTYQEGEACQPFCHGENSLCPCDEDWNCQDRCDCDQDCPALTRGDIEGLGEGDGSYNPPEGQEGAMDEQEGAEVSLVPNSCSDPDGVSTNRDHATASLLTQLPTAALTICPGESDWYLLEASDQRRLQVLVLVRSGSGAARLYDANGRVVVDATLAAAELQVGQQGLEPGTVRYLRIMASTEEELHYVLAAAE